MLMLLIIAPIVMMAGGLTGWIVARIKRQPDWWALVCFLLPPMLLILLVMPHGTARPGHPYDDRHHNPNGQPY